MVYCGILWQIKIETCHKNWIGAYADGGVRDTCLVTHATQPAVQHIFEMDILGFQD